MGEVKLPQNMHQLQSKFHNMSYTSIVKYCVLNKTSLTPEQSRIWKYSGNALEIGRPLDSCMIFMAGMSGAGKSSTINVLFDDPKLCLVSSSHSETKDPVQIQKQVCVTKESPPVVGNLSFIDVPGTFDTDTKNEAVNLAAIRKFIETRIELADRSNVSSLASQHNIIVRQNVYPNLILLVVKASDNRMLGPDSFFRKSLRTFKSYGNILDTKRPNLIIVLTHIMALPRKEDKFIKQLDEKISSIRQVVREVLGVADVDVIPVENEADDYGLEMKNGFYALPNGERSHFNLWEAVVNRMRKNHDLIGLLMVGWYFSSDCPEKKITANITTCCEQISDSDLALASHQLQNLNIFVSDESIVPIYTFQSLGYGFCPVTEEVKPVSLLGNARKDAMNMNIVAIENTKFLIPSCVNAFVKKTSRFHRISFFEKEEYQSHMKASYGIEAGFKLMVNASSEGRWVNNSGGTNSTSLVSLAQDIQVATFKLDNPQEVVTYQPFLDDLNGLPDEYSDFTASRFQSFFSKWGSHLIYEQAVGGAVTLNCTVDRASLTKDKLQKIEGKVSCLFKGFSGSGEISHEVTTQALKEAGILNEHLQIDGGDPPLLIQLEGMNPTVMQKWSETVPSKPTELRSSLKLYPYYNFLSGGPKYDSLREATGEYMLNTLSNRVKDAVKQTRNEASENVVDEAVQAPPSKSCFSKGTLVQLCDGNTVPIENLSGHQNTKLSTLNLERSSGLALKIGKGSNTRFCTYLDEKDDELVEYLVFHFSNGKTLIVSQGHMLFQFIPNQGNKQFVKGKQAKHFQIGEMAVYRDGSGKQLETPKIEKITREMHIGAYSPLTMSGTLFANGFLVSSYANTDSFTTAQAALYPLKIWSKWNNKSKPLNGNRHVKETQGIHPYAKFLISFRKLFT